jgi:type III pantothenate kinase
MLLAVDVGNTNIVLGLFDGEDLKGSWRVATESHRMPDEWAMLFESLFACRGLDLKSVDAVCLSSVVPPLTVSIREMAERYLNVEPVVVGPDIENGLRILYDSPREVGADRIVNSLAAYRKYGGPAIIVDFGTATTFDALSGDGDYLGGAIAPGITISMEALFRYAAKLPSIELVHPPQAIGKNTVASMQSGIMMGYTGLVEGLIARIKRELSPNALVIATGGLAQVIAGETKDIDVVDKQLTLDGLRMIYELNRKGGE